MNFDELDDPALVLPRVGDVHGTLTRLGFTGYTSRGIQYYRQFVPLFEPVPAPLVSSNISQISIVILFVDDAQLHGKVWMKYGYCYTRDKKITKPRGEMLMKYGYLKRRTLGKKIIEDFIPLIREETFLTIDFHPDWALRQAEKALAFLIDSLKTKRISMTMEGDSGTGGLVKKAIPPWEAVVHAVRRTLSSNAVRCTGEWWLEPEPHPKQPDLEKLKLRRIQPAGKYVRLSNFDRRNVRRLVRRPV